MSYSLSFSNIRLIANLDKVDYAQPSLVTPADIVGAIDADRKRSGLKVFDGFKSVYGFSPTIWIAPDYGTSATVAGELGAKVTSFGGEAYVDAPLGKTVTETLTSRSEDGANYNINNKGVQLCYPHINVADPASGTRLEGLHFSEPYFIFN